MVRMSLPRRVLLVLGLAAVLACAWKAPLDENASAHAQAGLKRALASFAVARGLNAVISVVQGTEVAVQPVGVGVVLTPGQVLDPINDLVEQFSSLMLTASVAFGVQLALIKFGGHEAVSIALSVLALAWGWRMWRGESPPGWLNRLFVGMLLVRFAVPLVVLGSDAGFRLFLEKDYAAGQAAIELSTKQFETLSPATPPAVAKADPKGWWPFTPGTGKMIEDMKDEVVRALDVRKRYEAMKESAAQAVEHIVKLIVVFLLQTLVVPLLLLWGLLRIGRVLVGVPVSRP
ncbi:MAG: hypothetical protein AB7I06_04785 [Burkholderiales bacterium]